MQAASRKALLELRPRVDAAVSRFSKLDGLTGLAEELYSVAGVLQRQPRLRRLLAAPASSAEARAGLATSLLEAKIGTSALQIVQAAVSLRWSSPWDLLDSIEQAGNDVLLAAAEQVGALEAVEDQLFRFERILDAETSLTTLLDEASAGADRRRELVGNVLGDRVHPVTRGLLEHAVVSERKRSIVLAIDDLLQASAARRELSVARVVSATELTEKQQRDLARALSELYGRRIDVRYAVEPAVRGGLVVRVGDEVIDGSVATRLNEARAAFAG